MNGPRKLPLRTGPGWKETSPRATRHRIAWESNGEIRIAPTDFSRICRSAKVGPVESPLTYDPDDDRLYRYACPDWDSSRNANGILGVAPSTGTADPHFPLHPLRWVPWLLQKIPGKPLLLGLVVTDASRAERPGIVLQHQIGLFHTREKKSLLRNLPAGCRHPVAAAPERDRILFHGPDGFQLVSLKGRRQLVLADPSWGDGRAGAAFRPDSEEILIGGAELSVLRPSEPRRSVLGKNASFPSWIDAERLLFAGNSGELSLLSIANGQTANVVSVVGNRHPEIKKARPAAISPDGRYFAVPLTRRAPFHPDTVHADQPLWSERQTLVIGDLEEQELWQHPGPVEQCTWAGQVS